MNAGLRFTLTFLSFLMNNRSKVVLAAVVLTTGALVADAYRTGFASPVIVSAQEQERVIDKSSWRNESIKVLTYRTNAQMKNGNSFGSQRRGRMLENHSYSDSPVKIIDVRIGKRKVTFKESFDDGDEWLKGLRIRIVNSSKSVVTHIGIDLLFERPSEQMGELPAFWNVAYGSNPFWVKPHESIAPLRVRPIQPGETEEISLAKRLPPSQLRYPQILNPATAPELPQIKASTRRRWDVYSPAYSILPTRFGR